MSLSRHLLFGKLDPTLFKALESATAFCKLRGNPYVELVHWLNQLHQLPDGDWQRILRHFSLDAAILDRDLACALSALPAVATSISDFSHHIQTAIERAWVIATLAAGDQRIRGAWLLSALLQTPELRRVLLGILPAFSAMSPDNIIEQFSAIVRDSPESKETAHDGSGLPAATPGEASQAVPAPLSDKSTLARYCTDLTDCARAGRIDPVIGRELEIRSMVDILQRRRQNNPLLTGDAGVGKTAVVEGLALAIARQEVPPVLREVRLLSLDVGALLAGASMKGEFEARLKALLEEATKSVVPIILFIDEIHTLIGAGGQAGTGDAANLLKPALARGTLCTIGATTWSEYKRHIEKDPALTRRFQMLQVKEPEESAATDMVRGVAKTFADHHQVWIMDEAIRAAVTLSHRYLPARQLPDKAISLLDTACARVAMSLHAPPPRVSYLRQRVAAVQLERELMLREAGIGHADTQRLSELEAMLHALGQELSALDARWHQECAIATDIIDQYRSITSCAAPESLEAAYSPPSTQTTTRLNDQEASLAALQQGAPLVIPYVNEAVVASVVSDWTGIPLGRMIKDDISAVLALPATLAQRVIGQPHALTVLGERILTSKARLTPPDKPLGVFLLVGPSGVGKTETALALADTLYGGEQNLITVNMSEYQEAHTVSTLKGSPPGYVGFGEGGVLTEAVRRRPYSVVLLDEIEKAHPDVHEMFFQVFDKGWMADGEGQSIDFKNTVILLTSNVGSELMTALCDDPGTISSVDALMPALQSELRKVFPAAFLGRLSIVPYVPLDSASLIRIVRLHLDRVTEVMRVQHDILLDVSASVVTHIVVQCGTSETGARLLSGFIEQHILPELSRLVLCAMTENRHQHRRLTGIRLDINPDQTDGGLRYATSYEQDHPHDESHPMTAHHLKEAL